MTHSPRRPPVSLRRLLLPVLLAFGCALSRPAAAETTIFIVRHAEKMDGAEKDPPLSVDGSERARVLRDMLRSVEVHALYSTNMKRTRDTLAPIAADRKLEISLYDYQNLAALAKELKERKDQNIVVSGHTNTVPALIKALGVERDIELVDADYDNLFVVTVDGEGPPRFLHLHFGY